MTENKKSKSVLGKCLTIILAILFAFVPLLAGCDLVTLNQGLYLTQTVAEWNSIKISKEELIRIYNSYGNANYDNSGTPTQDGVEKTIDLLVKRAILVEYLTNPNNGTAGTPIVNLTMAQQNQVWQNVYSSINSSVESIEQNLRLDDDNVISTSVDEEIETDVEEYKAYEHTYTYSNGVLSRVQEQPEIQNDSIALYDRNSTASFSEKAQIAYTNFFNNFLHRTDASNYTERAFSKYLDNLLRSEKGRNLSEVKQEAFLREVERIYKIYYDNQILTVYQTQFNNSVSITKDLVVQKFKELYDAQVENFGLDESSYTSIMKSSSETAYYNPESKINNWYEVYHLLIGYSDEQTTKITELKTLLENEEITLDEYNLQMTEIKNSAVAKNRFTGETMTRTELLTKIQNSLSSINDVNARIAKFREFVYAYSTDTASINAENGMHLSLIANEDGMVEQFTKAGKELYEAGKKGAISDLVETTYGFHIIMYVGDVPNVVYTSNTDALMERLNSTLLTKITNKTMLDKIIEEISFDNYYEHEVSLLNQIMGGTDVKYFTDAYKDLYE